MGTLNQSRHFVYEDWWPFVDNKRTTPSKMNPQRVSKSINVHKRHPPLTLSLANRQFKLPKFHILFQIPESP